MNRTTPQHESGSTELTKLGRDGWWVAIAMWLMFCGMMHDFQVIDTTTVAAAEEMIDEMADFEQDITASSFHRKAAFVLSFCLAVYCLATARREVHWESATVATAILLGLGWLYLSLFWSVQPGETARELVRVSVYAALAYGLSIRFRPLELMQILLIASIGSVLTSIAWELVGGGNLSSEGVYRLSGSLHPNPMGRFLLIIAVVALKFAIEMPAERKRWVLLLVACLVVLQLTRSRTALASVALALTATGFVGRDWRRVMLPAAVATVIIATIVLVIGIQGQSGLAGAGNVATMGRNEDLSSLTGRFPLWEVILDRSRGHELLGFGYGAFWNAETNRAMLQDVSWMPGHSHNMYVETYVNMGLIGLAFVLIAGISSLLRSVSLAYRQAGIEYGILVGLLVGIFVNGLAETGFVLPRELAIVTAMLGCVAAQAPVAWQRSVSHVHVENYRTSNRMATT